MNYNLSLIKTKDGSSSLYSHHFNDSYHSQHGAIQESTYVFIKEGLDLVARKNTSINILELGFGTGLNLLLTLQYQRDKAFVLRYESWEAYPIPSDLIAELNYGDLLDSNELNFIHNLSWNEEHQIAPQFTFLKRLQHFEEIASVDTFDLIYHDAFAPTKQPHLWQQPFLEQIARAAKKDAVLVTYCSQGAFRRTLEAVGFLVEKLPGPPGKREMVRAVKG